MKSGRRLEFPNEDSHEGALENFQIEMTSLPSLMSHTREHFEPYNKSALI